MLDDERVCDSNPTSIHIRCLNLDFKNILKSVEQLQARTQNIIGLVTTIIGVEENQRAAEINERAMKTNKNLARVTYIAVIFAPMAFISSFFSMESDLGNLKNTFWIYLVVAIPITLLCLLVADYKNLIKQSKKLISKCKRSMGMKEETLAERNKEPRESDKGLSRVNRRSKTSDPERGK
jgi:hypothetical protein